MTEDHSPPRVMIPVWLTAALFIAALLIGTGAGIAYEGRRIDDAAQSADTAAVASRAAKEAADAAAAATEQSRENGARACLIADGLRVLILASPDLASGEVSPEVAAAVTELRNLRGECARDEADGDG